MGHPYGSTEWVQNEAEPDFCFAAERRGHLSRHIEPYNDVEAALQASEERYRYTVALGPLIPWIADATGGLIDIDVRGLDCTGLSYDQCMGAGFLAAVHPGEHALVKSSWNRAMKAGLPFDYDFRLRLRDGSWRWHRTRAAPREARDGRILCWYGTIEDIHDGKLAHEATRWAADHDSLTGLWNRRAFMEGLHKALAGAQGSGVEVALLLIDLDQFKALNDQHGHGAGDALLKEFALRLDSSGTGDAMPGRLGGDEFALFVFTSDLGQLEARIAALQEKLRTPYVLDGQALICRASVGVAIYPGHGDDADALYKNADLALYEAKNSGCGLSAFRSDMRVGLQARLAELSMARHALSHDLIEPFYQPKIDLCSGKVAGFEALLRWRHEIRGILPPATIPAAFEDAGLAIALDERMFERIVADMKGWLHAGVAFGRIAFNVSSAEFRRDGFADRLLSRIEHSGIPASALELEVTETVFLGKAPEKVTKILEALRAAGLTIALDDFGMGYASLVHLKQFPVDVLKIDCSFIQTLDDPTNAAIVRAIIGLGMDLGITTVAEGVETLSQAHDLHFKGCRLGQGYLFSPAVPASGVPALLDEIRNHWQPGERRSGRERRTVRGANRKAIATHFPE